MFIGALKQKQIDFLHAGSNVPFPPSLSDNGVYTWNWDAIFDTALDIRITLEQSSFVGAVTLKIAEKKALKKVEILANGHIVGSHCAKMGSALGGEISVPVGTQAETIVIRLYANMENITLEALNILGACDNGQPLVWPCPKKMQVTDAYSPIANISPASDDADETFAAKFLAERLNERYGIVAANNDGMRIVLRKDTAGAYDGERYTVCTEQNTVTVTAASRIALLYGADTVLQLAGETGIPHINVDDKPSKELRGLHIGLPERKDFEFTRRLFRYVMIPLRYNFLIVEFAGGMRFDKHPEISEAWLRAAENYKAGLQPLLPHSSMVAGGEVLEKHEVATLLDGARELGIEIIPEVQSFGHVQYITYAHPELAERIETPDGDVDTRADDTKPVGFYPHCYCPSLDASYDLIYDIIDEIVEVVKPTRYVHMGHDEIYHLGRCARCQVQNPSDLYVKHVCAMYEHLKKKGLGMMIWSDMLHTDAARKYYVPDARARLPRDIVMMDFSWYFHPENDIEDELLPYDYKIIVGNLYSSHYTRYRSRMMKDGMIGGQISLWLKTNETRPGEKGKWWDMMYLSEMLWNPEQYEEDNRLTYTHLLSACVQPRMRDELRNSHSVKGYSKTRLPMPGGVNSAFPPLGKLCPEAVRWCDGTVEVNACFDRLIFEHATEWNTSIDAWGSSKKIGSYTVIYENGEQEEVDVLYGFNILQYNKDYAAPMPYKYYRHTGYPATWFSDPVYQGHTADGSPLTVLGYVWQNPSPDQKIRAISYRPAENDTCGLILSGIVGEIKN